MKTRREFFKTLLGSIAVLAATIVVPLSLIGAPKQTKLENYYKALDSGIPNDDWIPQPYRHITSGYARIEDLNPIKDNIQTIHCTATGSTIKGPDGLLRFYWTKGV